MIFEHTRSLCSRPWFLAAVIIALGLACMPWGHVAQGQAAPAANPAEIRVALLQGQSQVTIGATASYQVVDRWTNQLILAAGAAEHVTLQASLGLLYVNDRGPFGGPLAVRLVDGATGRLSMLGRQYRGWLEVRIGADGQLLVVNQVGLEVYLMGVVPREMPASWPVEALKAQAVAARTYAVSQVRASEASGTPFAVVATTDSQVYGGSSAEVARSNSAVEDTRGMIITYQGQPISALYHAASGGHTENSEVVWSGIRPYLRGVPDFDQWSPRYSWEVILTLDEVRLRLASAGHNVGQVVSIELTGMQGVSGRTSSMTFRGSSGQIQLRSEEARRILGLWSSLVEVSMAEDHEGNVLTRLPAGQDVVIAGGAAGTTSVVERRVGQSYSIGADGILYRMSNYTVVSRARVAGAVQFAGSGWGHGVGMSQHGAYQMALNGNTHDQILMHYYLGTALEQR